MSLATDRFVTEPLAPSSSRFTLSGTTSTEQRASEPSPRGTRPWGLLRARPVAGTGDRFPAWSYDPHQQKAVGLDGRPLVDSPVCGPPTAKTTSSTDGEDPPSSEDWHND